MISFSFSMLARSSNFLALESVMLSDKSCCSQYTDLGRRFARSGGCP